MNGAVTHEGNSPEDIFLDALELKDAGERAEFLDRLCGPDGALRLQVEELIRDSRSAAAYFESGRNVVGTTVSENTEECGAVVGQYRLVERIGEGGMGVVFRAEQFEPFRREVALKIIKPGMDTRQVVARFDAERQALALMDHPSIARVLGGGTTASGRPYFVMELVRGLPITRYCDERRLSTEERLKLFIRVCHAVQHAHQKGVIHRDLKPSNILVSGEDEQPLPKVIDFGVAKAVNQDLTGWTVATGFPQLLGTPAYMSPEQAGMTEGGIDTRTDIYSLGVVLYELLAGRLPFDEMASPAKGMGFLRREISNRDAPLPSSRVTSLSVEDRGAVAGSRRCEFSRLVKRLRGDLDSIVMKCLEKDRNRRYGTADDLAADLGRHLHHEPVIARPIGRLDAVRKLLRRRRPEVVAGSVLLVVLVAGAGVSGWQAVRAIRAEREARDYAAREALQHEAALKEARVAGAVKEFLIGQLVGSANPFLEPRQDADKRPTLDRIAREAGGRFQGQPLIEADIRFALGDAYKGLGAFAESAGQFERCLEIRRRDLGVSHSDTLEAVSGLVDAYIFQGRSRDARRLLDESVPVARTSGVAGSIGAYWVLYSQGHFLLRSGDAQGAVGFLRDAYSNLRTRLDLKRANLESVMELLIDATRSTEGAGEALRLTAVGVEEARRTHSSDDPRRANLERIHAELLIRQGQWEDGMALLDRCIPVLHRTLGSNHISSLFGEHARAAAWMTHGDSDRARTSLAGLHPRWMAYFPMDHARWHSQKIAVMLLDHGEFSAARAIYEDLRRSYEVSPPAWPWEFEVQLSAISATQGWPAVGSMCRQNFDSLEEWLLPWLGKAWVFRYLGDEDQYQKVAHHVLSMSSRFSTVEDQRILLDILGMGPVQFSPSESAELEAMVKRVRSGVSGLAPRNQVWTYRALGQIEYRLGHPAVALQTLRIPDLSAFPGDQWSSLIIEAMCLQELGQFERAREMLKECDRIVGAKFNGEIAMDPAFLRPFELSPFFLRREAGRVIEGSNSR